MIAFEIPPDDLIPHEPPVIPPPDSSKQAPHRSPIPKKDLEHKEPGSTGMDKSIRGPTDTGPTFPER